MDSQTILEKIKKEGKDISPIARLFKIGREKSFVSYDDILNLIPYPELDLDYLDRLFASLLCAGIGYGEDEDHLEDIDGLYDKAELNGYP